MSTATINDGTDLSKIKPRKTYNVEQGYTVKNIPMDRIRYRRWYRVIIGVHYSNGRVQYVSYRKDKQKKFCIDQVDFDSRNGLDHRFIFTENQYENLLDHLTQFDDTNLYLIAKIGKKEVDPISLLPII